MPFYRNRFFTLIGVAFIIAILVLSALQIGTTTGVQVTLTVDAAAARAFPTIPPGGTSVTILHTYFHPTGLISLPLLSGWDLPPDGGENTIEASTGSTMTRVEATFSNPTAASVVHVFAEQDPNRKAKALADLNSYYAKDVLQAAWDKYTGGWHELSRKTVGDSYVIDFELKVDFDKPNAGVDVYLGRQITRFSQDWMLTLRLVVPNNNPQLLDQLQNTIMPHYQLWPQVLTVPLSWASIIDYTDGYIVRYPPSWGKSDGGPGRPFKISGQLAGANTYTLTTRSIPNQAVKTEDDAKTWVIANLPNATVQRDKTEKSGDNTGFSVSYNNPDADGNQHSGVVTLLNGTNGKLYTATVQSSAGGIDFLDDTNTTLPPEIALIRRSFFLLPSDQLMSTATPTQTPPVPTVVGTPIPK